MLNGFTIYNFRNFGDEEQWISPLGRVNIFVGTNNSGKSNVLRYIKRTVAPALDPSRNNAVEQLEIDRPRGGGTVANLKFWAPFPPKGIEPWDDSWTDAFATAGLLDDGKNFIQLQISRPRSQAEVTLVAHLLK